MYRYIIRTFDPESTTRQAEILHDTKFTEEAFDEMVAECFALAIKRECNKADFPLGLEVESCCLDDYVYPCADIMVEKFNFVKPDEVVQVFEVSWLLERDRDDDSPKTSKLIYKYIDKLLNKTN